MNKRQLHHVWTKIRWLKPRYLFGVTLILSVVCIFALRANNEHMIKLRTAVYAADKNNTNIEQSLQALQSYVTTHMNTNLSTNGSVYPPIQLRYTYNRIVQAQSSAVAADNSQLYTEAQNYCQQQDPTDFSGHNRVPCVEQYIENNDSKLATIPDSLYQFDFVSPTWSPDLAGWTMIAAICSGVLFIASFLVHRLHHRWS